MKKILFILLVLLTSIQVFAKENSCCEGLTPNECIEAPKVVYNSMVLGYVNKMLQYKEQEGETPNVEEVFQEAKKILLSQEDVNKYFEKCGQENTVQSCQECLRREVMARTIDKLRN